MLKRFFTTDPAYSEAVKQYAASDAIMAIALYVFTLAAYYLMGLLYVKRGLYLGIPVNLALIAVCVVLVIVRGQKLSSVGITPKKLRQALICGAVFGVVITLAMNVIPSIVAGGKPISLPRALYNIFYYFIVIGLSEEIVFRGYIQPRLYGLIKNDFLSVLVAGLMFYLMHLPFQMVVRGLEFDLLNMVILVALHFVFNFVYRKYNSLAGSTAMHGLLDWGGSFLAYP